MDLRNNADGRSRLVRGLLAVVLTVVAVDSLRKGKRLTGALAGVGALALGYGATTGETEEVELDEIKKPAETAAPGEQTADESRELRCAICGQPIRPGQRRGPNEEGETVHDTCEVTPG